MSRFSLRFLLDVVAPTAVVAWIAYFVFAAFLSATGYRALADLRVEATARQAELDALIARRVALEKIANQLHPKSIDPDLLDEKIRTVLGYVGADEVVVPRAELERLLKQ